MNYITSFLDNYFLLIDAMSIYIMVGLLFAGILKQLVPNDFVSKNLGNDSTWSVVKATIFGIPLPVCSCSVIPIAQGLRREGASKGAVQSFLISTPITGVDSILATFSFFGLLFTIFRVISSIIIAIVVGLIQNFVEKESIKKNNIVSKPMFSTTRVTSSTPLKAFTPKKDMSSKKSFSIKKAFSYAYVTLFEDMVKALFIGLLLGALFTTFIPKEYSSLLFENKIITYFVILIFAIPLYTCATASLPIAAAFMLQGMSAGAVFIFLTAGPATSAVTMSVVYKMLGRTSLIVYVSTIAILSLLFGFLFDSVFDKLEILNLSHDMDELSIVNRTASVLMLLLMFYYLLIKPYFTKKKSCCSTSDKSSQ